MDAIKTVRIVANDPETQGFYVIINEDDFDKKTMKVYDGPDNPAPVSAEVPATFEAMAKELAELRALVAAKATAEGGEGWGASPEA